MKQKKASECKCVECGKQAVAFWPIIDPDIPNSHTVGNASIGQKNELCLIFCA